MAERPARIAAHIAGASLPSEHTPPRPGMTIRSRLLSRPFFAHSADSGDDIADVFQVVPGLDRVHLELDAIGLFEVEYDLRQLQRVDAERGELRRRGDFAGSRVRV